MRTSSYFVLAALVSAVFAPVTTFAKSDGDDRGDRGLHLGRDISIQVKAELKDRKEEVKRVTESVKQAVKKLVVKGTLTAVNGTDLTVKKGNGETVLVHAANAKLVRRYGATMTLADLQLNDQLEIVGTMSASTTTEITATHLRDISLQAHNGTFVGTVKSVSASTTTFVLTTQARKDQTIIVTTETKLTKNGEPIGFSDIAVGNKIRVSGVWNRSNENVTAKNIVITTPMVRTHVTGRVTVDGGHQLTILGDDQKIYSVRLNDASVVYSTYVKMNKKEIAVGDQLDIWAKHEAGSTNLRAYFVRDLSQQDRVTRVVTLKDRNSLVQVEVGDRVTLKLGSDHIWSQATSTNASVLALTSGKTLTLDAKAVGQADVTVVGEPRCRQAVPACATPSISFRVTVNVVAKAE